MPKKTDSTIQELRELSEKIDEQYGFGKEKEGKALLLRALKKAEKTNQAYMFFFLAEQKAYENDLESAIKQIEKALNILPDDHFLIKIYGAYLARLGKHEEAINFYNKAIKINPDDYFLWRNKGFSLIKIGKDKEANECLENAQRFASQAPLEQADLAYVLFQLGEEQKAFNQIDKVLSQYPQSNRAYEIHEFLRPLRKIMAKERPFTARRKKQESRDPFKEDHIEISAEMRAVIATVRREMGDSFKDFRESMKETLAGINDFLTPESKFRDDISAFLVLRKWNSYTPSLPRLNSGYGMEDRSIGGGYFILHKGIGTVVDPGYNFLENFAQAGGRICDINNIVLTHAHNDHTIDFESIMTLVYKYNDEKVPGNDGYKKIQVFANTGTLMKFSGLLDLRGAHYLENVHTLMPGHEYDLGNGLSLRALPAFHDEVVATKYAVGLHFIFSTESGTKHIVMTSDTGLYPQTKNGKGKTVANCRNQKEIWEKYGVEDTDIALLIPHIGSVKQCEITADLDTDPEGVFYPNHLGLIGTARVIMGLRPHLAVVSEFGEELKDIQHELMDMVASIVEKLWEKEWGSYPNIIPGDITFSYDVTNQTVYSLKSGKMVPAHKIGCNCIGDHACYHEKGERPTVRRSKTWLNKFAKTINRHEIWYLKPKTDS